MKYSTEIVTSSERLQELLKEAPQRVVLDVETKGELNQPGEALLGVAIAFRSTVDNRTVGFYVPVFWDWHPGLRCFSHSASMGVATLMVKLVREKEFIGHNIEYDRMWVDACFKTKSKWHACTRKMWHLADDKDSLHGFGLKTAQIELLNWEASNETELREEVLARGGDIDNGDHYLASVGVLGKYAALDAIATLHLYEYWKPFFDKHDYWGFLADRLEFQKIINDSTEYGMAVDAETLVEAVQELSERRRVCQEDIRKVCKEEIAQIEGKWLSDKLESYKMWHAREKYLAAPEKWKRFNPNSSQQRTILFHDVLKLPVLETTESGAPKSDRTTIAHLNHPAADVFVRHSEADAVLKLARGYLESLKVKPDGSARIHFKYNVAATVSDRLGGFKPYSLNMPFSEEKLMKAFKLDEGFIGIGADLVGVEPCLIAGYSEDPTLLKVYRDGLGDVYLDLALKLFPEDRELQRGYNQYIPIDEEVKKGFKRQRGIAKVIHLAVSYTATFRGVHYQLRKHGYDISEQEAMRLVNRYWETFALVKQFENRLKALHKRDGHLRNILGRIIQVPNKKSKDTMNRFIQSGGHDILALWVREIAKSASNIPEAGMKPLLPDIHDFTGWVVRKEYADVARKVYSDTLGDINRRLALPVQIRAETKLFSTLAGLKGE